LPSLAVDKVFTGILERAKSLDPANTRKWFDDLKVLEFKGGSLTIGCADEAAAAFMRDNCRDAFTRAAQQVTGHLVSIDFAVNNTVKPPRRLFRRSTPSYLHPDYTFDNFVVGPSNRLAHASCVAVSHSPGNTYTPLFLNGSSGLI
jgi:chromosomal replication initiator protein